MPTPIYKCPECGAKVIYNEKKNSWKCAKCGQEFSEYDLFIQGLEEWKADAPKASEPLAEPVADYDYDALLSDFLRDNEASIKVSDILRNLGFLLPLIVAAAVWFTTKGIFFPLLILIVGTFLAMSVGKGVYRGLAPKMINYFSEIKSINDKGIICVNKSYRTYWVEPVAEDGKTGDNYKCNIGGKTVCFNDFTLGYWVGTKHKSFVPISHGQGVRVMHKLNLNHFVMIFKLVFPSVAQKFYVSGPDYFNDEAFSQYKVRTRNMR